MNSARGFMFAVGCIQAQACHTNECPVGVATQDKLRQRALDVDNKSQRVARFHANTMKALGDMAGAAGLDDPRDFLPHHLLHREANGGMSNGDDVFPYLPEGFLLREEEDKFGYLMRCKRAWAEVFTPTD